MRSGGKMRRQKGERGNCLMIEGSVHDGKGLTMGATAQYLTEIYTTRGLLASNEERQV